MVLSISNAEKGKFYTYEPIFPWATQMSTKANSYNILNWIWMSKICLERQGYWKSFALVNIELGPWAPFKLMSPKYTPGPEVKKQKSDFFFKFKFKYRIIIYTLLLTEFMKSIVAFPIAFF